jgi:hypothetical protein
MSDIDIDWLPGSPTERCTLQRLIEQIPEHDVLNLVCHGKMIGGTGWMLLEHEDGSAARVSEIPVAQSLGKSGSISTGKGGKWK